MTILEELFPKVTILFINNISIKGLYTNYNNKLKLPGIRHYIYKYLQNLDRILERIERANIYIELKL